LTKSNQTITIGNAEKTITLVTGENPSDKRIGYLGVGAVETEYKLKHDNALYRALFDIFTFFAELFKWVFILSLGIGLANLLPLGPVDGGRMLHTALVDAHGKKKGTSIWAKISWITLIVLLILLVVPIIKNVLFKM
jgi:membrane-associated protease RseP (regulator of RpoE activity)